MIARTIFGLCAVALFAGTAGASEANKGGAKNDPDKMVCRTERDTGTRLGRSRVCKTNAEWVEQRRRAQQSIDRIQNNRAADSQ